VAPSDDQGKRPYDAELDRTDATTRPELPETSDDDADDGVDGDEAAGDVSAHLGSDNGDVEEPSAVAGAMAALGRFARRARTKPADADAAEPEDADTSLDALGPGEDRAAPPKPLVSGDPLLTGPTPVVRARSPRPSPSSPPAETPSTDDARPAPSEATGSAAEATRRASSPAAPTAPPAPGDARSLFEPVDTRARPPSPPPDPAVPPTPSSPAEPSPAVVTSPHPTVPPPVSPRTAPPPPPAPSVVPGPVPAGAPSTAPRRAATRGSQATGPQPVVARAAAPARPTPAAASGFVGRRPRVRRVTRVVRHVDPWSVFKVAAVFSFVAYGIALVAGVLLWNVAYATGTVDNIERGLESTGWETFELQGGEIFHNAWIAGLFGAVGLTGLAVLVATLFNLITDLVGGVRMTVLEEEVVEKPASPTRRFSGRGSPVPPSAR